MKEFWDERYKQDDYVYGKEPNEYLKAKLKELKPGSIIFPADGEGRNAVFAAKEGWEVSAFDISTEGRKKALKLAKEEGVRIDYKISDLQHLRVKKEEFDAIALIYAHFPPPERKQFFSLIHQYLKEGGKIIFEGFGPKHPQYQKLNPAVGGPQEERMLFSEIEMRETFQELHFVEFYEGEIELNEGDFHKGKGWVIRFVAEKRNWD